MVLSPFEAYWGYLQMSMAAENNDEATITTHAGTYRLNQLPIGLSNA